MAYSLFKSLWAKHARILLHFQKVLRESKGVNYKSSMKKNDFIIGLKKMNDRIDENNEDTIKLLKDPLK